MTPSEFFNWLFDKTYTVYIVHRGHMRYASQLFEHRQRHCLSESFIWFKWMYSAYFTVPFFKIEGSMKVHITLYYELKFICDWLLDWYCSSIFDTQDTYANSREFREYRKIFQLRKKKYNLKWNFSFITFFLDLFTACTKMFGKTFTT